MSSVRFFGPVGSSSGYGIAVRNMASAFSKSKLKVNFQFSKKHINNNKQFISGLSKYNGSCNIDFYMHPPSWSKHKSSNYKIAYFYWEADRLPTHWVRHINYVNEIWAPCRLVKSACIKAGFKGKMHIVPTPLHQWNTDQEVVIPTSFSNDYRISENVFKFYSIFQWHYRKGPDILLSSYWREFGQDDKVCLILKVNPLNIAGNTLEKIRADIIKIKNVLKLKYYAPVYVITSVLPIEKIWALHKYGDCYVSPHRGEGWGLPIHDSMYAESHLIVTKFGGITENLNEKNSNIIKHDMAQVRGMEWSPHVYGKFQRWANPSSSHLSRLMRDVYNNGWKENFINKKKNAKVLANSMSIDNVSRKIEKLIFKR